MQQQIEQVLILCDGQQRQLGQLTVDRREGTLLLGTFVPGPDFPAVKSLFRDFEEAVNCQALSVVDKLDAAIAALGLYLRSPDGSHRLAVHDVQIWTDGGMTCRLSVQTVGAVNGAPGLSAPIQPVSE